MAGRVRGVLLLVCVPLLALLIPPTGSRAEDVHIQDVDAVRVDSEPDVSPTPAPDTPPKAWARAPSLDELHALVHEFDAFSTTVEDAAHVRRGVDAWAAARLPTAAHGLATETAVSRLRNMTSHARRVMHNARYEHDVRFVEIPRLLETVVAAAVRHEEALAGEDSALAAHGRDVRLFLARRYMQDMRYNESRAHYDTLLAHPAVRADAALHQTAVCELGQWHHHVNDFGVAADVLGRCVHESRALHAGRAHADVVDALQLRAASQLDAGDLWGAVRSADEAAAMHDQLHGEHSREGEDMTLFLLRIYAGVGNHLVVGHAKHRHVDAHPAHGVTEENMFSHMRDKIFGAREHLHERAHRAYLLAANHTRARAGGRGVPLHRADAVVSRLERMGQRHARDEQHDRAAEWLRHAVRTAHKWAVLDHARATRTTHLKEQLAAALHEHGKTHEARAWEESAASEHKRWARHERAEKRRQRKQR